MIKLLLAFGAGAATAWWLKGAVDTAADVANTSNARASISLSPTANANALNKTRLVKLL